jgi:hypothetical protein
MTFAKGFLLGSLGCLAGCLACGVGLVLLIAVAVSACVGALPIALSAIASQSVEITLEPAAPHNAVDLIVEETRVRFGDPLTPVVRVNHNGQRRAWLVVDSHGRRSFERATERIREAIDALESRGTLPRGSVHVRPFYVGEPRGITVDFGDWTDDTPNLSTRPSKR